MKPIVASILAAAAMSIALPAFAADDLTEQGIRNDEDFTRSLNTAEQAKDVAAPVPRPSSDASGIIAHGGSAYIVQKLGAEITLPDGTRVQPDGKIIGPAGEEKSLNSGNILSLDGQMHDLPFGSPGLNTDSSTDKAGSFLSTPFRNTFPGLTDSLPMEPSSSPDLSKDTGSAESGSQPTDGSFKTESGDFSD